MATEMVPFSPIPAPTNPAQLPSLPAWLQQRSAALAAADKEQYRSRQNLPATMILSPSEVSEVQRHIFDLQRFNSLEYPVVFRGETMSQQAGLSAMVASLLIKSGQRLDKASSDVLTEDYFDALEDIPAWAVREALRKWNRGESVQVDPKIPHDFRWAPKPPILRKLAEFELVALRGRIRNLQRLCEAEPVVEYSDEHRKGMLERLSALFHDAINPVHLNEAAE